MLNWRIEPKGMFYDTLVKWWESRGFPVIPKKSLPNTIYVVSRDNKEEHNQDLTSIPFKKKDLYAIPVYRTDSNMYWIGFPTGNKEATPEEKEGALAFLLSSISTDLTSLGGGAIVTTSANPILMEAFRKEGYNICDEGTNYYLKQL